MTFYFFILSVLRYFVVSFDDSKIYFIVIFNSHA